MNKLKVRMLGKFHIECSNRSWHLDEWSKAREFFCFLLLHRHGSFTREELASRFWPDSSPAQGKKNLRQSIWRLHSQFQVLEQNLASRLVLCTSEQIRINPILDIWVDVESFRQTYSNLRNKPELSELEANMIRNAAMLYQGDFLEGWHQDWPFSERNQLQHIYLEMLGKLMNYCIRQENYEEGIQLGETILRYDPASERTHQQLMKQHYLLGDRTAALHQFERCVKLLREELDVAPAKNTLTIYRQICDDEFRPQDAQPISFTCSHELTTRSPAAISEAVARLTELKTVMEDIQFQIQHQVRVIENLLLADGSSRN